MTRLLVMLSRCNRQFQHSGKSIHSGFVDYRMFLSTIPPKIRLTIIDL